MKNKLEIAEMIKEELLKRKIVNYAEIDENMSDKKDYFMHNLLIYFSSETINKYTTWKFKDNILDIEEEKMTTDCHQCQTEERMCFECSKKLYNIPVEKDWIVTNQSGKLKCSKCQEDTCEHIQYIEKGIDYNTADKTKYPYGYYPYTKRITLHRKITYVPPTYTLLHTFPVSLSAYSFNVAKNVLICYTSHQKERGSSNYFLFFL